jgi:hypothetical protein
MRMIRRWATLRGERCLTTMVDASAPYTPGQELVVGNRAYVVTRVLRVRGASSPELSCWEIWARRRLKAARPSAP